VREAQNLGAGRPGEGVKAGGLHFDGQDVAVARGPDCGFGLPEVWIGVEKWL